MSNVSDLFRSLVIYGICLPLAVFLGYSLANGVDLFTLSIIGLLVAVMCIPLFMRWHHPWLVVAWNLNAVAFFLPGRPRVGMVMCVISLAIAVLHYILDRRNKFISVPSISRPLIMLGLVVFITARVTGGFGMRTFGGESYGGRRYFDLLIPILGFFALVSQQIPNKRANFYVGLFLLGSITSALGNLASFLPQSLYFLFLPFPNDVWGMLLSSADDSSVTYSRLTGVATAASALYAVMLARYGIKEIFNMHRWWRLPLFLAIIALTLLGGFRSMVISFMLSFVILFYLEGLTKTRLMPMMLLTLLLGGALLVPMVSHLPLSMQRALSILPLPVDPITKADAMNSTEWRLKMWQDLLPDIPKYLIVGKGYSMNPHEMEMVRSRLGVSENAAGAVLAGDYHNGALSVIIPFGIFGAIAFLWFLIAALRALYHNHKYGLPEFQRANTFIFAYFLTRALMFSFGAGALYSEMFTFTGLIGLSISLNGGVAKPVVVEQPKVVFNRFKLHPALRQPVQAQ